MRNHPTQAAQAASHWHLSASSGEARLDEIHYSYPAAVREADALVLEALPIGGGLATQRNRATGRLAHTVRDAGGATLATITVSAACTHVHALIATSEAQRARMRRQAAAAGVGR